QPGQGPSHFGLSCPHSAQAKTLRAGLALTAGICSDYGGTGAERQCGSVTYSQRGRPNGRPLASRLRVLSQRRLRDVGENDLAVLDVDADGVSGGEALLEQRLREAILDLILNHAAQRAGAEDGVPALLADPVEGGNRHLELHALGSELSLDALHLVLDDLADVLPGQRVEDNGGVQPVNELRPEDVLHGVEHLLLHL